MKDFLGNVTLTLEDIRKASNSDTSQSYQLQGVKTGAVEIKVKVISEETEVSVCTYLHRSCNELCDALMIQQQVCSCVVSQFLNDKYKYWRILIGSYIPVYGKYKDTGLYFVLRLSCCWHRCEPYAQSSDVLHHKPHVPS